MVKDYKYLGITIDRRLSFIRHVADTKRKVDSRLNMIKAITNLKIGVNTKVLITLKSVSTTPNQRAPWLEPPIQVIIQNPIQKKVDPEGAAIEATNIIVHLIESRPQTIHINTDASS